METAPAIPYIYQPGPADSPRAFAIGGPGAEHLAGERYTREDAVEVLRGLRSQMIAALAGEGRKCSRCGGTMTHYRLKGYQCRTCH